MHPAPFVFDRDRDQHDAPLQALPVGPMTGPAFRAYVEQFLAPALQLGDVVVLDNLAAHKVDGVRRAIAAAGASILYLPPYDPDMNPIEQLFRQAQGALAQCRHPHQGRALVHHRPPVTPSLPSPQPR
jgi:transposase